MGGGASKPKLGRSSVEIEDKEEKGPDEHPDNKKGDNPVVLPKSAFKIKPKLGFQEMVLGAPMKSQDLNEDGLLSKPPLMTQYVDSLLNTGLEKDQDGYADREE